MDLSRSPPAPPPPLSAEAAVQFQEGINLLLSRWTALQMAVQNEWGGPHSREKPPQLAHDIFSLLTQSKEKVYIDDVEDMLDEFMLSLNTEIADGSIEEIAEKLMVMHEECLEGDYNSIKSLKEADPPKAATSYIRQANSDDDSDDDIDDTSGMVTNAPRECQLDANRADMIIDEVPAEESTTQTEDGWTVVGSRRNRGRKI